MAHTKLFSKWCDSADSKVAGHRVCILTEKAGVRSSVEPLIDDAVRGHYDNPKRLESWAKKMKLKSSAEILRKVLPRTSRARSGHVGEILATESIPGTFAGFTVPVRRLRWLDGREMALRGEDLIGIEQGVKAIRFLKAESKSRKVISASVVNEAREALRKNHGRPSPHAMILVAKILDDAGDEKLALVFADYAVKRRIELEQLVHLICVFSGNNPQAYLSEDLQQYGGKIEQHAIGLMIGDHQDFIAGIYGRLISAATS